MTGFARAMLDALRELLQDKGARTTMIVSILVYACLYPQPYTSEVVRDVPVVAVDQDRSTASRELLRRVHNNDGVAIAATVDGLPAAEAMFFNRKAYGVIVIPPNFERDLLDGQSAPIAAFGDASYFTLYSTFSSAVTLAARSLGTEVRIARLAAAGLLRETAATVISPVAVSAVPLFNPHGGYASYVVPAAFVLILQQTLLMGIGIMHAGRPHRSGIDRLAAPATYIALYAIWVAATQLLIPVIYGIPRLGDAGTLFCLAIPFLMAVTAMGFALVQVIPKREGVIFFLIVQGMPLFFLSGVAWPIESVPEPIRTIALLIPSSSAIPAAIQVDQLGATAHQILPTVVLQITLAAAYATLAIAIGWCRNRTAPEGQH